MAQFTKKEIIRSFMILLNETPLDKITVQDITDKCGVNRKTFYYYFEDKYDLLKKILEDETSKAIDETNITNNWKESFIIAGKFALENKKAIYHIYNSLSREELENYLSTIVGNLMSVYVEGQAQGINIKEEDKRYVVEFYKYAFVGILTNWISNGMKDDPTAYIDKTDHLLSGSTKHILELATNKN